MKTTRANWLKRRVFAPRFSHGQSSSQRLFPWFCHTWSQHIFTKHVELCYKIFRWRQSEQTDWNVKLLFPVLSDHSSLRRLFPCGTLPYLISEHRVLNMFNNPIMKTIRANWLKRRNVPLLFLQTTSFSRRWCSWFDRKPDLNLIPPCILKSQTITKM